MSRRILIVDDDPSIRQAFVQTLGSDADIRVAESAERALSMLGDGAIDVILSDVRMPGLGGLSLLHTVRERAPAIDVIMMSAFDDMPTVSALANGRSA